MARAIEFPDPAHPAGASPFRDRYLFLEQFGLVLLVLVREKFPHERLN